MSSNVPSTDETPAIHAFASIETVLAMRFVARVTFLRTQSGTEHAWVCP